MGKDKKNIKEFFWQNALWFAGLVMAIVNLWLASKLSPLSQSITIIAQKVEAIEATTNSCVTRNEFDLIEQRLDRIQAGLNDLIKIHMK